jgi:hypothetical protein
MTDYRPSLQSLDYNNHVISLNFRFLVVGKRSEAGQQAIKDLHGSPLSVF